MRIKRFGLIAAIILIFVLCYRHMNENFDVLSRYPYQNEESRQLIKQYLDDEEIEYIIEFDIAPVYFIEYISFDGFDVRHINAYNTLKGMDFGLSDEEIVNYIEYFYSYDYCDNALALLSYYELDTIVAWLAEGDIYDSEAVIEEDPSSYEALLSEHTTVLNWQTEDLVSGEILDQEVVLREDAYTALQEMIAALQEELIETVEEIEISISTSYLSYEDLVSLGTDCSGDLPGHSDHQLGLAIDFEADEEVLGWLYANAETYGYYFTKGDSHLRYRGGEWLVYVIRGLAVYYS